MCDEANIFTKDIYSLSYEILKINSFFEMELCIYI